MSNPLCIQNPFDSNNIELLTKFQYCLDNFNVKSIKPFYCESINPINTYNSKILFLGIIEFSSIDGLSEMTINFYNKLDNLFFYKESNEVVTENSGDPHFSTYEKIYNMLFSRITTNNVIYLNFSGYIIELI